MAEENTEVHQTLAALGELRKTLDTRLDDCITRDKAEKIIEEVVRKMHPVAQKAVLPTTPEQVLQRAEEFKASPLNQKAAPWTSEYGKKFGNMRNFLRAAQERSPLVSDAKTLMTEGTPAVGGYLVPTEFSNEVITLMQDAGIIMGLARVLPMSTWKRTIPSQLTDISVGWVDEGGTKAKTNPTFGQVTQVAKVMAAIIKCTDELLRDSAINLQAFLAQLVAESMVLEIERVALIGDVSGASDPFNGVRYASGVNVVSMGGSSVSFDDVADLIFSLSEAYAQGATLVLSRAGLKKLMKLKDEKGAYLWQAPAGNAPATIWNVPYKLSGQIPSTFGDASDETLAMFGNFGKYMLISPRQDLAVKVSQDAYDSADSTNAFTQDQTWLRFTQALSIDVARGASFSYLQFK